MVDQSKDKCKNKADNKPVVYVNNLELAYDPQDKTVLNCLEKNGVEVHYHCRDGFCGACRVTLVSGEIEYSNGEPLAFIGDNEILPCCCIPSTDITIEID